MLDCQRPVCVESNLSFARLVWRREQPFWFDRGHVHVPQLYVVEQHWTFRKLGARVDGVNFQGDIGPIKLSALAWTLQRRALSSVRILSHHFECVVRGQIEPRLVPIYTCVCVCVFGVATLELRTVVSMDEVDLATNLEGDTVMVVPWTPVKRRRRRRLITRYLRV